jgi:hypothetical protein
MFPIFPMLGDKGKAGQKSNGSRLKTLPGQAMPSR